MRVFFEEGVVREVCSAEVKPMDVGGGKVVGTEIDFVLAPNGDKLQYVYKDSVSLEMAGMMAMEFVKQLYTYGMADFSDQPVELM